MVKSDANSEQLTSSVSEIKADIETLMINKEKSDKAVLSLMRNEITNIYYENVAAKSLKSYEKENLNALYEAYKAMGGNSYVQALEKEMNTWQVVP